MVKFATSLVSLFAFLPYALAQTKAVQCGGVGWTGSTTCTGVHDVCAYITEELSECRVRQYTQCGGVSWTGNTICVPNTKCVPANNFYSFCQALDYPEPTPISN